MSPAIMLENEKETVEYLIRESKVALILWICTLMKKKKRS